MLAPYPQLIRAGYRRYAGYRQAALAGLSTNVVFGLLRAAVLAAVLAERGTVGGYDLATAITYVWLGQGLLAVVLLWGDTEFSDRVRSEEHDVVGVRAFLVCRWTTALVPSSGLLTSLATMTSASDRRGSSPSR